MVGKGTLPEQLGPFDNAAPHVANGSLEEGLLRFAEGYPALGGNCSRPGGNGC